MCQAPHPTRSATLSPSARRGFVDHATYNFASLLSLVEARFGLPALTALDAGTHHDFHIPLVILAAATGAILGDNLGFLIGRAGGYRLLRRYGHLVRLDERKLKLGMYLFRRHGGKVVFFGRFVAVLRAWAAFLAGTSRMPWDRFSLFNAAGGILWATLYGLGGYALGDNIHRLTGPVGIVTVGVAILAIIASLIILRRNEERLEAEAERAMPGPLDDARSASNASARRAPPSAN